jgi:prepilin-type N-terminal cleavage/methylation domain-containing protein
MKKHTNQKGFTLIELLVVIAIIAILAVVVVLTLNPAELLRQARDSTRVSDFATLKSALSLYSTDVATTTALYGPTGPSTRLFTADANAILTPMTVYTTNANGWWGFAGGELTVSSTNSSRAIDGSGWIPVNLNAISSGAPISNYPVDPVNTGTSTQYIYTASTTVFKLAAQMESSKYGSQTGSGNVTIGDGGNSTSTFEAGTNLTGL